MRDVPPEEPDEPAPPPDRRLYCPAAKDWRAHIKPDFVRQYCYTKHPGEEFYHQILGGELYLDDGESKLCLTCALRTGVLTTERLHWQGRADSGGGKFV